VHHFLSYGQEDEPIVLNELFILVMFFYMSSSK